MNWRRWWLSTAAVLGLAALVTGTALALRARSTSFGWFAYAPLGADAGDLGIEGSRLVTDHQLLAWALAVLGLVVLAGCCGYLVGSRSAGGRQRRPPAR